MNPLVQTAVKGVMIGFAMGWMGYLLLAIY